MFPSGSACHDVKFHAPTPLSCSIVPSEALLLTMALRNPALNESIFANRTWRSRPGSDKPENGRLSRKTAGRVVRLGDQSMRQPVSRPPTSSPPRELTMAQNKGSAVE